MKNLQTIGVMCALLFAFVSCEQQSKELADMNAVRTSLDTGMEKAPASLGVNASSELIINLISDPMADPHSSLMGLHLAQKARKSGQQVTVFLNVHGVKLMSPGADTLAFHGENLHQVLKDLMADGGVVRACPHCMMVHEVESGGLLQGVEVMQDGMMMEIIANNPAVFTY